MNAASTNRSKVTCQMCKKQFDQRVDLSRHQCIELHLKLLKKKKETRKKKWRDAHWKRKIDLSYIETTSLTQLSQNIADNLSFCVDGTQEDLRAYSREVKDYLNTELGAETPMDMFLKCSFPEYYESFSAELSQQQQQTTAKNSAKKSIMAKKKEANSMEDKDSLYIRKANSYFTNGFYLASSLASASSQTLSARKSVPVTPSLSCKYCRAKFAKIADLVQHQRVIHHQEVKTAFDEYNASLGGSAPPPGESLNWSTSNVQANSPIGFLGCDPYSYVINLHWDRSLKKKCATCQKMIVRPKFDKHVAECKLNTSQSNESSSQNADFEVNQGSGDEEEGEETEEVEEDVRNAKKKASEEIIFEPRTEPCAISPSLSMKVENESFESERK